MAAYRATINDSTGYSPNRMMLGRETTLPLDLMLPQPPCTRSYRCSVEYVEWVKSAMERNFELAREHLAHAAVRQKKNFDLRAQIRKFSRGDWILRFYAPKAMQHKLDFPFTGPYLVIKSIGEVNYLIQKDPKSVPFTIHVDDMKLYLGPDRPESWLPAIDTPSREQGIQCGLQDNADNDVSEEWEEAGEVIDVGALDGVGETREGLDLGVLDEEGDRADNKGQKVGGSAEKEKFNQRRGGRLRKAPQRFGWD